MIPADMAPNCKYVPRAGLNRVIGGDGARSPYRGRDTPTTGGRAPQPQKQSVPSLEWEGEISRRKARRAIFRVVRAAVIFRPPSVTSGDLEAVAAFSAARRPRCLPARLRADLSACGAVFPPRRSSGSPGCEADFKRLFFSTCCQGCLEWAASIMEGELAKSVECPWIQQRW
jgi:hypothetical protein